LGNGLVPNGQDTLWSSNTSGQTGNSAILTITGALSVINASGTSVFSTPNSNAQPSNYIGCYGDGPTRAMALYNNGSQQYNLQECQQIAQQNGSTYFGLQNSTSGTNAQCALSSNFAQTSEYGTAGNCTKISDGSWSGGGYSNAVYNTSLPQSNYFLILQSDGNMCIYRGSSPNDNQGLIWASGTTGKQQDANPNYIASKGKYGQNWIASGSTLAAGDFVGSTNGNMALIMLPNGNLVLYTFTMVSNCSKMNDGNTGGGVGANALYNIGEVGIVSNLRNLAYIDGNSMLHPYPANNSKTTNSYTKITGLDSIGFDIPGAAYGNTSVQKCQTTCNNNSDCAGFAFSNQTCYPKTSGMYPSGSNPINPDVNLYVKNLIPNTTPTGVPNTTNNIDTITYQNYVNGGNISNNYGLGPVISTQTKQLDQLQQRIDMLSKQMSNSNNQLNNDNYSVTGQMLKNMSGLNSYVDELVSTKKQIEGFNSSNIDNLLKDSDITILQQNYNYLFWSILATGTILISINVLK
jgi:hypothetical protein